LRTAPHTGQEKATKKVLLLGRNAWLVLVSLGVLTGLSVLFYFVFARTAH
jgi:hypothetical protein